MTTKIDEEIFKPLFPEGKKCVRMDSKLIGSNIARQSRHELIHTTLVKFLKTCTLSDLSPEKEERAKEIQVRCKVDADGN